MSVAVANGQSPAGDERPMNTAQVFIVDEQGEREKLIEIKHTASRIRADARRARDPEPASGFPERDGRLLRCLHQQRRHRHLSDGVRSAGLRGAGRWPSRTAAARSMSVNARHRANPTMASRKPRQQYVRRPPTSSPSTNERPLHVPLTQAHVDPPASPPPVGRAGRVCAQARPTRRSDQVTRETPTARIPNVVHRPWVEVPGSSPGVGSLECAFGGGGCGSPG